MAIATLLELPETQEQWESWAFANMAHHRDIIRTVLERTGTHLTESILDPFDYQGDPTSWLAKHQLMHQHMDAVLGIAGYNLIDIDWGEPEAMQGWIAAHANEHVQAGEILNLG